LEVADLPPPALRVAGWSALVGVQAHMQHARRQEAGVQRVGEDALIAAAIYEELLIRLIWFAIPVLHFHGGQRSERCVVVAAAHCCQGDRR